MVVNKENRHIPLRDAVDGDTRCAIACLHAQNNDVIDLRGRRALSRSASFAEAMSIPRFRIWTSSSLTGKSGKKLDPSRPPTRTSIPWASEAALTIRGL
jgi:hypothetical protein